MQRDWHDTVVCLSVCDAVHCGYKVHHTPKMSEQVNRKCPPRNMILQL